MKPSWDCTSVESETLSIKDAKASKQGIYTFKYWSGNQKTYLAKFERQAQLSCYFQKNVLNDNHISGRNKLQVMSVVKEVKSFESAYNLGRHFT